jgi:uncharacterized membrane protein YccF (DUF307 family)
MSYGLLRISEILIFLVCLGWVFTGLSIYLFIFGILLMFTSFVIKSYDKDWNKNYLTQEEIRDKKLKKLGIK